MNLPRSLASAWAWLRWYYWGVAPSADAAALFSAEDAAHVEPAITGEDLIRRIQDTIELRRSALVTGPRGCGKSYCSEQAIRRAADAEVIGGWRFLQGNREIPRDTLSEDTLVINAQGRPELLRAIPLRPLDVSRWSPERRNRHATHVQSRRQRYPDWPALPTMSCTRAEAVRLWRPDDWIVLYLDEINRFGDGFLDSLLSITEEGKLVRRGEDYYVPVSVVATANPPGYDVTAKKLSPPLQARIARSFRVAQPGFDDLVKVIIRPRLAELAEAYERRPGSHVPEDLARLAAAVTLCLWGDPDGGSQGSFFLTAATRKQLAGVMRHDKTLQRAMKTLAKRLISFGPDARAVQDWLGCAVGLAVAEGQPFDAGHLSRTAVEVLGHKVRETFNEGAEPALSALKEHCVAEVVRSVLTNHDVREQFVPPLSAAARALATGDAAAAATAEARLRQTGTLSAARHELWLRVLSRLPDGTSPRDLDPWLTKAIELGGLTAGPVFLSNDEKSWVVALLRPRRGEQADRLAALRADPARQLEQLLAGHPVLALFRPELAALSKERSDALLADEPGCRAWLGALAGLLEPDALEDATIDHELWRALLGLVPPGQPGEGRGPAAALGLLRATFEAIGPVSNFVGRQRCLRVRDHLARLEQVPFDAAAERLAPTPAVRARLTASSLDVCDRHFGELSGSGLVFSRLTAWFELLASLPVGQATTPTDLLSLAHSKKALGLRRLFLSPQEQRFAAELLRPLADALIAAPECNPGWAAVHALDAALHGVGFSPGPLIRAWARQASDLPAERREEAGERLRGALDRLEQGRFPRLTGSLARQESCARLIRQLGALLQIEPPSASAAVFKVWEVVWQVGSDDGTRTGDAFEAAVAEAVNLLRESEVLGLAKGDKYQPAKADLEHWHLTPLRRIGASIHNKSAPVGPHGAFQYLWALLRRLFRIQYPIEGLLPFWLRVLPELLAEQDPARFADHCRERLGSAGFRTFVERVWLGRVAHLAGAASLLRWVKGHPFDHANCAADLAAGGRYPAPFLREVLRTLSEEGRLAQEDSFKHVEACQRLVDDLRRVPTIPEQAVRQCLEQLSAGSEIEDRVRAALLRGVSASGDPFPHYDAVVRALRSRQEGMDI